MRLEIWVDGSMEIMHIFFFSPILKKKMVAMANITIFVINPKKLKIFMKLKI
jgi:hypothetical protein